MNLDCQTGKMHTLLLNHKPNIIATLYEQWAFKEWLTIVLRHGKFKCFHKHTFTVKVRNTVN